MRNRAQAIIAITDRACHEHLDDEYAEIARRLVARLARSDRRRWPEVTRASGRRGSCTPPD
jgi:hypothetical protein